MRFFDEVLRAMAKKKKTRKRLSNIKVNEVSFVDEPAIEETFVIVKRLLEEPVVTTETPEPADVPVEKADNENVKEAWLDAVASLRKVAGTMDEEDLGVLAGLMSFSKYRYGYDYQPSDLDPRLKRMVSVAKLTDEQWDAIEKSMAEPDPEDTQEIPVASEETPAEEPAEAPAEEAPAAEPVATEPVETAVQKAARLLREHDAEVEKQQKQANSDAILGALSSFESTVSKFNENAAKAVETFQHATGAVD